MQRNDSLPSRGASHSSEDSSGLTRRRLLQAAGGAAAAAALYVPRQTARADVERVVKNGRIRQSVCKWCYPSLSVEELCAAAAKMGLESVELLGPADFPTVKKYGLVCAMVNTHSIAKGLNRPAHHEMCLKAIREAIDAAAEYGYPNVITFSGNREGMDDETGLQNCTEGLRRIVGHAEQKKVTICMELLNSRVNHKDYMCDRSEWGVALCKRVDSERFKLLNDLYHMQIMEGDLIRRIREYKDYYAHYHTGGNPGRNEIDHTQEINYPAVMRAIAETGFQGYVGQEFLPSKGRDPLVSLAEAAAICDV